MTYNFHKEPQPPFELKVFNALNARKTLSSDEKQTYKKLQKGYHGELKFFDFLNKNLPSDRLILNSLRLQADNSEFQLDSLLFHRDTVHHFEVKNFEGDFYIQ